MAEGKDTGFKELEEEITCAICHDHYTEPKVLSCCHYYCKQCIFRLALRTGLDKPFSCPECRKDTTLPEGNVDKLQGAFFINRMKQIHSKLERATGEVEAKCEICSEDKAEAFCRQCAQFICAECVKSHKRMRKAFPGHKIVTLEELKEGGAKEIVVQEPTFQTCKKHEDSMKMYCFDCGCLICRDCTIIDHQGHKYQFIKEAVPATKEKLSQHLEPLRQMRETLSCAVREIQTTRSEVEAQGHSVVSHIESSFDELHQIIEHRKHQLLAESAKETTRKLEQLSGQEKSVSTACAVVQSVIEYTEQCVEHSADDEIMCMHAELHGRIDREIEEQQKQGKNLEPVEEVDMAVEVSCVEDLKKLCQSKAKLTQLPLDPTQSTVTFQEADAAEVGKTSTSKFTLNSVMTNGKPSKRKCVIECHLKCLCDGSTTKYQVVTSKGGDSRVQYTPTVRGRHELTVTLNGVAVAGSPFPVLVSIHPKKLGKPVQVVPELKGPTGVTINSEGEIIVTEGEGDVVVLDRKGNRLRRVKQSDYNLGCPWDVTVDENDNVYFTDAENNIIFKSDKLMKTVLKKQTEHQGEPGHLCVAVVGYEIMTCERDNKGTIKVYNKELEYVREITSHRFHHGYFTSISSDERGNLYISDNNDYCIQVFSTGGEFLYSFGQDGDGVNKLKRTAGVCVAGQYVYVTDCEDHSIAVFTTEGEYVTRFGQEGSGEGDLSQPLGVCVDKDGFVYVCDSVNLRIQIF